MVYQKEDTNSTDKGKNVFIYSVACERRELDAQKIVSYLKQNDYAIINDLDEADYIFLMTCGVTKNVSNVSLELIKNLNEYNAELIVVGCVPETNKNELVKIFNGTTVSTKHLEKIDDIFPNNSIKFRDIQDENSRWKNFERRSQLGIIKTILNKVKPIGGTYKFLLTMF